jgi:hypothetical protein
MGNTDKDGLLSFVSFQIHAMDFTYTTAERFHIKYRVYLNGPVNQ